MTEEEKKAAEDAAKKAAEEAANKPSMTLEEALAELNKTKSEAATRRQKEKEYQDRQRELENKLASIEQRETEAEKKRLEEEGKWKERAELAEREKESLRTQMLNDRKAAKLEAALSAAGAIDPQVAKLIQLEKIQISDAGEVLGVEDVVNSFKAASPGFFKAADPGANPNAQPPIKPTGSDAQEPPPNNSGTPTDVRGVTNMTEYEQMKQKALLS